jgi:hypothetical protein
MRAQAKLLGSVPLEASLSSGGDCLDAESRRSTLRASPTAQSHPGGKDAGYDSGSKDYTDGLQRTLLDGVSGVIDCVFGGVAPLLNRPQRRSDAIAHSVSDGGFDSGDFAKNIIDLRRFL